MKTRLCALLLSLLIALSALCACAPSESEKNDFYTLLINDCAPLILALDEMSQMMDEAAATAAKYSKSPSDITFASANEAAAKARKYMLDITLPTSTLTDEQNAAMSEYSMSSALYVSMFDAISYTRLENIVRLNALEFYLGYAYTASDEEFGTAANYMRALDAYQKAERQYNFLLVNELFLPLTGQMLGTFGSKISDNLKSLGASDSTWHTETLTLTQRKSEQLDIMHINEPTLDASYAALEEKMDERISSYAATFKKKDPKKTIAKALDNIGAALAGADSLNGQYQTAEAAVRAWCYSSAPTDTEKYTALLACSEFLSAAVQAESIKPALSSAQKKTLNKQGVAAADYTSALDAIDAYRSRVYYIVQIYSTLIDQGRTDDLKVFIPIAAELEEASREYFFSEVNFAFADVAQTSSFYYTRCVCGSLKNIDEGAWRVQNSAIVQYSGECVDRALAAQNALGEFTENYSKNASGSDS